MPSNPQKKKVMTAKGVDHSVSSSRKSKPMVKVLLKNSIGPKETIKKVRIPIDAPISKLKEKIGELYGLDPDEFQLSHIPGVKSKTTQQKTPDQIKITSVKNQDTKAPVKIVLRDRSGNKKFQKKLVIPDSISIGELRDEVSKKLGMNSDEFSISIEKYL